MDDKALLRKDFDVGPYVVTAGSDEQPVIKLLLAKVPHVDADRCWLWPASACRARSMLSPNLVAGLAVGTGAGWKKEEFELLGVPLEDRGRLKDECLAAACSPGPQEYRPRAVGCYFIRKIVSISPDLFTS